jgi:hypothetical protein
MSDQFKTVPKVSRQALKFLETNLRDGESKRPEEIALFGTLAPARLEACSE